MYSKAGIFCTSSKEVNGEVKSVQVDLGDIEIIRKPRSLATVGLKDKQQQWTVDCRAEVRNDSEIILQCCILTIWYKYYLYCRFYRTV